MSIDGYFIYVAAHNEHYKNFLTSYPTMENHGVTYVAMFLETTGGDPGLSRYGAVGVDQVSPKFCGAWIPASRIAEFASLPGVVRMEPSRWLVPLLNESTAETNIRTVQTDCNLKGQGVVVGIVDSGVDANHPDFTDHVTGQSRIEWLWDEKLGPSTPLAAPYLFNYPTAISTPQDNIGHGTHVAGIAAGNGYDSSGLYAGVAPESTLMVAKCFYDVTYTAQPYHCIMAHTSTTDDWTVLNGIRFIFAKADAVNKPAVVNLSVGGFYGPHDGTSIMESVLDTIVIPSRLVVASAGNELDKGYHAGVTLASSVNAYQDWRWVARPTCGLSSAALGIYEDIDGWYDPKDDICIAIKGRNLSGPITFSPYPTNYIGTGIAAAPYTVLTQRWQASRCNKFTVYWNKNAGNFRIRFSGVDGVICAMPPIGNTSDVPGIDYGPYNIRVVRRSTAGNGVVDMWNGTTHPVYPTKGSFKVAGLWDDSEPSKSLVTPFATAKKVITVGAYVTREDDGCFPWYTDTLGSLASFSGCGPTRDGRMKPEVTAPGAIIISAKSSKVTPVPSPCVIATPSSYFKDFGTSMSAPHVTGLLALWLQQTPSIGYEEAVSILRTTSRPVVDSTPLPNNRWGFGKIGITCGPVFYTPTPTNTPGVIPSPAPTCCTAERIPNLTMNPDPVQKPRGLAWKQSSKQLFVTASSIPTGYPFFTIPNLLVYNFNYGIYSAYYRRVKTYPTWQNPYGLALSPQQDFLFLTDNTANFVQKIDVRYITSSPALTANVVATFGNTGTDPLNGPRGVCVDPATNLVYVADSNNHRIRVFQETSTNVYTEVYTFAGPTPGNGPNQFNSPTGLLIWNNALYVADTGNRRIMKYTIEPGPIFGAPSTMVDATTHSSLSIIPMMMALGPDGNVYVTDQADQFEVFDPTTEPWDYIQRCGSHGSALGQLSLPFGVALDSSNRVYVADSLNNRIERFIPCLGTPTVTYTPVPTPQMVIPAENACSYDGVVETSGDVTYVDLENRVGASINFVVRLNAASSRLVVLTIRYANGTGANRNMTIRIIGTSTSSTGTWTFPGGESYGWNDWRSLNVNAYLSPGDNRIILTTLGTGDSPIIDEVSSMSTAVTAGTCPNAGTATPTGTETDTPTNTPTDTWTLTDTPTDTPTYTFTDTPTPTPCCAEFDFAWGTPGPGDGEFGAVFGVALDRQGYVYVTDSYGRVQKFTSGGGFLLSWGSLNLPVAVAVSPSDLVYVADKGTGMVHVYDTSGVSQGPPWSIGVANSLTGVAVDPATGDVFTCETDKDGVGAVARIQRFSSTGTPLNSRTTGLGGAPLVDLRAIWAANNTIYIVEGPFSMTKMTKTFAIDASLTPLMEWPGSASMSMKNPGGVATDVAGNVYVSDGGNHFIEKYDPTGHLICTFGSRGSGDGQFSGQKNLVIAPGGRIYIADMANTRVEVFKPCEEVPADTPTPTECCQTLWSQGGLDRPRGVAAGAGFVYEVHANGDNAEISVYDLSSVWQGLVPVTGISWDVSDMVLGSGGNLFIGDRLAQTVWVVDPVTGTKTAITGIGGLSGLYVDPAGVLYVTTEDGVLLRYEKECDGPGYVQRGRGSLGLGGLGVVTRAKGVLYVASPQQGVYAVQEVLQTDGTWVYSAGAQLIGTGPADGQLMDPFDLASDADGSLYVEVEDGVKKFALTGGTAAYEGKCGGGQVRMDIGYTDGRFYIVDEGNLVVKIPCLTVWAKPAPTDPVCYMAPIIPTDTPTPVPACYNYSSGMTILLNGKTAYSQGAVDVAVDPTTGDLFTVGSALAYVGVSNNVVVKSTSSGGYIKNWAVPGTISPHRLATDRFGNVYVAYGSGGGTFVQEYDKDGNALGGRIGPFLNVRGLAINPANDNLYVLAGGYPVRLYVYGTTDLSHPAVLPFPVVVPSATNGITLDASNNMYIGTGGYRMGIFNATTGAWGSTHTWSNTLGTLLDLEYNPVTNQIIAVSFPSRFLVLDTGGNLLGTFGTAGTGVGRFWRINRVAVETNGCILLGDPGDPISRIERWCPCGGVLSTGGMTLQVLNREADTLSHHPVNTSTPMPVITDTPMPVLTQTPTHTPTVTPTATIGHLSIVAAPNVSRNGEPVHFRVVLPKPARVSLTILNLVGERVFSLALEGNTGLNDLVWKTENLARQSVASGLYIYTIETDDGRISRRTTAKVLVIR